MVKSSRSLHSHDAQRNKLGIPYLLVTPALSGNETGGSLMLAANVDGKT